MPKLSIDGLRVTYGPIVGTDGVSLAVDAGETVALIGANGAGKSSTLKAVLGMVTYPQGRILLDSNDLKGLRPSQVMRRGVGYSPEGRRVFPQLSVADNLQVGGISRPAAEVPERMERIFGYFPRLEERRSQPAGTLSGGEQQMLAISRALMSRPTLLLLDEPSLGLAPQVTQTIFRILREVNQEGMSILLVEQNAHLALGLAQWAYVLETGEISMEGTGQALLASEEIRKAYLGE